MGPTQLFCPPVAVQLLPTILRTSCTKLPFIHTESIHHYANLSKRDYFRQLDCFYLSSASTHTRSYTQSSGTFFTATLGGDTSVDSQEQGLQYESQQVYAVEEGTKANQDSRTNTVDSSSTLLSVAAVSDTVPEPQWSNKRRLWINSEILDSLVPGVVITGKVVTITRFGAFVNVGGSIDGLVHLRHLSNSYVRDVHDIVCLGQEVKVKVLSLDVNAQRLDLKLMNECDQSVEQTNFDLHKSCGENDIRNKGRIAINSGVDASEPEAQSSQNTQNPVVVSFDTLTPGAVLSGVVENVRRFGAFVNLGPNVSGFMHISNMANFYVKNAKDVVQVGQKVRVKISWVDVKTKRSGLMLMTENEQLNEESQNQYEKEIDTDDNQTHWTRGKTSGKSRSISVTLDALKPGVVLSGKVTKATRYGAFVDLGTFASGLIHISNLWPDSRHVDSVEDVVQAGQEVRVEVLWVDVNAGHIGLKRLSSDAGGHVESELREGIRNESSSENTGSILEDMRAESRNTSEDSVKRRVHNLSGKKVSGNTPAIKYQKGEIVTGIVKKIVKGGVILRLDQDFDGVLPSNEVFSGVGAVIPEGYFKLGQEVRARVLRTKKDKITLTMKRRDELKESQETFSNNEERATSPFEIAFRRNSVIAHYLDEKKRLQDIAEGRISKDS